ncbi:N-((2S)-2-amino-2-carboxyethyl)-L-glutamate dehydrogenase [Methylobacterium crusticola]|uniref:N-((2S)-2-amino-2-carboxyethyl)-L-glutamate dehydrogenase n=1 Tax=Methylobacterium crusticola TaxID=1697972 RepID=A0ABQ4R1G1_9HYPH|nr:2,3-diaminopropionate biosynthesis protein SbnB [Methylobacterium crusticola]GJD51393.1 N-((2S)-2-amino-2-carboxyethyl)-L-glutamate dehydrogenase [Methylobacterium crusticola]
MARPGPAFAVVGARAVADVLARHRGAVADIVRGAYLAHRDGRTVNPDSGFLRFPDRPSARIIALPARLRDGGADTAGIKWIASFPGNHALGVARASAVIVLNDMETGFPTACLEGSLISAARTAASAALAAGLLHGETRAGTLAVVGAGPIAATTLDHLACAGWRIGRLRVHDLAGGRAEALCARLREAGQPAEAAATAEAAVRGADLVLLATTAAAPHLVDPGLFTPAQTVLHLSLRDLGVPVILAAQNVVDDVEHCLKAQTSVHLAEQATGGRDFVAGTIADLLTGTLRPDRDRVRVLSPFGLGVLDLAVARFVLAAAAAEGRAPAVEGFFP